MACFLCGHEKKGSHHLGCVRIQFPELTKAQAAEAGLIAPMVVMAEPEPDVVEVLKPGTMTTEPPAEDDDEPAQGGETVGQCEVEGCENHKYSASARAKYCADHRDPKNRKE